MAGINVALTVFLSKALALGCGRYGHSFGGGYDHSIGGGFQKSKPAA